MQCTGNGEVSISHLVTELAVHVRVVNQFVVIPTPSLLGHEEML